MNKSEVLLNQNSQLDRNRASPPNLTGWHVTCRVYVQDMRKICTSPKTARLSGLTPDIGTGSTGRRRTWIRGSDGVETEGNDLDYL
jgi:hypothetical protein